MISKWLMATVAFFAFTAAVSAQTDPTPSPSPTPPLILRHPFTPVYSRPAPKVRFKRYVSDTFGPVSLAKTVVTAGWSTYRNDPEEWGGQWEGFGRRVASNMGKTVIQQTTIYGLDEALKFDSHYYRSTKRDAGSKIKNALLSTVTARNKNGKRVVGVPRLVGTFGANIIATEAWYPSRYGWKDGARDATYSLGFNAAYNLFKEFIWKK
jgi:hypothetical protein